jgi:transposase
MNVTNIKIFSAVLPFLDITAEKILHCIMTGGINMARSITLPTNIRTTADIIADLPNTTDRWKRIARETILITNCKISSSIIADVEGISVRTVFNDISAISTVHDLLSGGVDISTLNFAEKRGGKKRTLFSPGVEDTTFLILSEMAETGHLTSIWPIHEVLSEAAGKLLPLSTVYYLLDRHHWKKLMPEKEHPKSDPQARLQFIEVTLPEIIAKLSERYSADEIIIWYQDEMRGGRITDTQSCWCPPGMRPKVKTAYIRSFEYIFGCSSPQLAAFEFIRAPTMSTEHMSAFLAQISEKYPNYHHVIIVDGASSYKSKDLIIPSNITLVVLPPYSPQLNGQENMWKSARAFFKNMNFDSLEETMEAYLAASTIIANDKAKVRRVIRKSWMDKIISQFNLYNLKL